MVAVYLVNGSETDRLAVENVCDDANQWLAKGRVAWSYKLPPLAIQLSLEGWTDPGFPSVILQHRSTLSYETALYLVRGAGGWAGATSEGQPIAMLGDWTLDAVENKPVTELEALSHGRYDIRNWQIGSMLHETFHMFGYNHEDGGVMQKPWDWPRVGPPKGSYRRCWFWP